MKLMLFLFLLQNIIACHKALQNLSFEIFNITEEEVRGHSRICYYDGRCFSSLDNAFDGINNSPVDDKIFFSKFEKKHLFWKKTLKSINSNNTNTVFKLYADIKNDFRKFVKLKFSDYIRTLKSVCFLRFNIVEKYFKELNKLCEMYFEFEYKKKLSSKFIRNVAKRFDECEPKLKDSEISSLFWKKSNIFRQVTNSAYFPLTRLLLYYEIRKDMNKFFDSSFLYLKCNKKNILKSNYDKGQKNVCISLPLLCKMFFDFEHEKEFIFKIKNINLWFLSSQNYIVHSDKVIEYNNVFLNTR